MEWWSLRILKGSEHRRRIEYFFCQDRHGVMNVDFSDSFLGVSYTCVGDYTVYGGGVYIHSLVVRTYFCAQRAHCVFRTSSCVSHTRMAQVSWNKGVCHMSVFVLYLAFSSLMFHPSLLFLYIHFDITFSVHNLAVLSRPKSAGHAQRRTCIAKFGYLAKSDANAGNEPNEFDKNNSVDDDTMLINDPNHNFSDFSKTTSENTRQFGVPTVFESSVSHVSHDDFALQIESRESMQSGNRCWTERKRRRKRFCGQCCRVDVKER